MNDPWSTDGTWLRCALHAHTNRSDGELTPRDLAGHYARAGYDVLAMTDHWRIRRGGRLVYAETVRLDGAISARLAQSAVGKGGLAVATVLAVPLSKIISDSIGLNIMSWPLAYTFPPAAALIWLAIVIVLALVASYLPAASAARLSVRDILAYE